MSNEPEEITPSTSGGTGQQPTPATEAIPRLTAQLPRTVPETVSAIAGARTRDQHALALASAYMTEITGNVGELKQELSALRLRNNELRDQLEMARIENEGLRTGGQVQRRHDNVLKGIGIAGGLLCGIGADLFKGGAQTAPLGIILALVGIAGVLISCFSMVGVTKK